MDLATVNPDRIATVAVQTSNKKQRTDLVRRSACVGLGRKNLEAGSTPARDIGAKGRRRMTR